MNLERLAFKNLARRPGRTATKIVAVATTTAVLLVWGSLTGGFTRTLEDAATSLDTGFLQIHAPTYRQSQDIYAVIEDAEETTARLESQGLRASPRLFAAGLGASGERSAGVRIRGLNVRREATVTRLHQHVSAGNWLSAATAGANKQAVVGEGLARQLGVAVGGELILLGHALDGSLATEIFRVAGILRPVNADVDNRGVFLEEATFRELFSMPAGAHEIAVGRGDESLAEARSLVVSALSGPEVEVVTWRELKPLLARMLDLLSITTYFTLAATYLALGGLIVNMTFMNVYDRMREYGMMQAVGMTPAEIVRLIAAETLWLAVFAAILAWGLGLPAALHIQKHGLDLGFLAERVAFAGLSLEPILFAHVGLRQTLAPVLFMLVAMPLFCIYPALTAARQAPLDALRHR